MEKERMEREVKGVYILLEGRPDGDAIHRLHKNLLLMMKFSTFQVLHNIVILSDVSLSPGSFVE